jgi:L-amino acid N-acyltransferase YncA
VSRLNLPDGPRTLEGLFKWPQYNAEQLLVHSAQSATHRANFRKLMENDIEIHDSYSGTGTGSVTLHIQHENMISASLSRSYWWLTGLVDKLLMSSPSLLKQS